MDIEDCCWTLIVVDYLNLNSSNSLHLHKAPLSCFSVCTHCSSACFTRYLRQSLSDMIKRWSWFTQHSLPAVSSLLRSSNAFIFPSQEVIYCKHIPATTPKTHTDVSQQSRVFVFSPLSYLLSSSATASTFVFCEPLFISVSVIKGTFIRSGLSVALRSICFSIACLSTCFGWLYVGAFVYLFFFLFPHELLWLDVEKTCISWTLIIFKCIFLA